jgi:SAM-dependent methyltransferase
VVFAPWAARLVDAVAVAPGERVLDVASGTGVVARAAAARGATVVAADISPAMLARSAAHPDSAGISFVEAPAEAIPLPDGDFDVVLCQQGLQFFPDRGAALAELRRLLRPGGRLAVAVWLHGHRLEPFDEYSEALAGLGVEPTFPGAFDPASFGIAVDALRELLAGAGLAALDVGTATLQVVWPDAATVAAAITGTPFGPLAARLAPEPQARLHDDLLARFAAQAGPDGTITHTMAVALGLGVAPH